MRRPDQDRFDLFTHHLESIDGELEQFRLEHKLRLDKNLNRQPCRVLRTTSNPERIIDIHLDGHWLTMEYQYDLPHNVGVAAYYRPSQGKRLYKRATVVEHQPFSVIRANLTQILNASWAMLQSWPPPILTEDDPDAAKQGWARTLV